MNTVNTKSAKNPKTIQNIKKQSKFEYIIVNIICFMVFIAFGYLAIVSFVQTSKIDPDNYGGEVILYNTDNIAVNILLIVLFFVFVFAMKRHYDFFAKVNMKYLEAALPIYVLLLGFIWIFSVTSVPAADSANIFETATEAAQGSYNSLRNGSDFYNSDYYGGYSYYNYYPFQLGFVFICEIIYRIFGTDSSMPVQILNVICVALAYLGIAKITKHLFKRRSIEFITVIMLAGCFQPILFCTFVYGNIIGMCCAIWASFFLIRYFQAEKYVLLIPCGVLLVLSTLAKYNNMIYLVAFAVMLVIHTIKRKKWQSIAFALAICICTVGASNLVILSYEYRADTELSSGVSQTLYLDMGLNESTRAPGWYNQIALDIYKNNALDTEAAQAEAMEDIKSRLSIMADDPDYTLEFLHQKIVSQWNETTYESIWVSEVKSHSNELNGFAESVYNGSLGQLLEIHFNFYMMIIFLLFSAGIILMLIRRKTNIETVLLPLVILGAFGYHLLFEGKSQYVLTYIVLFIPFAAYALNCILEGKYVQIKKYIKMLNTVPEKAKK